MEQRAVQTTNIATLRVVAGDPSMHDPTLLGRLGRVQIPTLVIWGDSDRIATPTCGQAYAAALSDARFEIVMDAGRLPELQQPVAALALIDRSISRGTEATR